MRTSLVSRLLVVAALSLCSCGGAHPTTPGPPAWHVTLSKLQGILLCVWGTSPESAFTVGGPLGNGTPSVMLRYDGTSWHDLHPGGTETLWWTHGTSATDVWAVGENGRILHWDGAKFAEHASGTTATLYGVWAAGPNDVWAVGGTPEGAAGAPNDVVLRFDGSRWAPSPPPQALGRAFFKVWGTASDNLYVVGEAGTVWHLRGAQWTLESQPPLAMGTLFTVNGCGASEVYAVGGSDVLRSDGVSWSRVDVQLTSPYVNGVACASPGNVVIVGSGGLKQRLVKGQWLDDSLTEEPYTDLHGAWADPSGAYWTAGGDFFAPAKAGASRSGVLAYYGSSPPSSALTR